MKLNNQIVQEILANPKYLHGKYHELAVKYNVSAEKIRSIARKLRTVKHKTTIATESAVKTLMEKLETAAALVAVKKSFDEMIKGAFPEPETPKVLFFDIETSFNTVWSWGIGRKITLTPDNIIEERKIITVCYKFEGDKEVKCISWKNNDDKLLLQEFSKVLDRADIVITHNGDAFDLKHVKARCIYHGIPRKDKFKSVDTLKLARKYGKFNSCKLDYLGQFLGLGRKIDTGGIQLWKDIIFNQDKEALIKMENYCKGDVELLEKVYNKLKDYGKQKTS